jgi:hypothetical protein
MIKKALSDTGLRVAVERVAIVGSQIGRRVAEKLPHPVIIYAYREIFFHTNKQGKPEHSPDKTKRDEETNYRTDVYLFTIKETSLGNGINP